MGEQSKENGIRHKYNLRSTSKLQTKNSFCDFEFSDDENGTVIPHRNTLQQNDHQDSSRSNSIGIIRNKRAVLREYNYTKNPIIHNIPIQIEARKSNPPPIDVKTDYLLASTCDPFTMYTPSQSTSRGRATVTNNITSNDDDIQYFISTSMIDIRNATINRSSQIQQRDFGRNDNLHNNISRTPQSPVANKSQQMTKFNNFSNLQEYLKLLEKIVPSIYKSGGIENCSQNQYDNEVNNNGLKEQLDLKPKLRINWLSDITREDTDVLKRAIYGPVDEVLISKFNINITRRDIETLLGQNWLNDEVINFYMNLLMERSEERHSDGLPRVYAMNTFFIPRLQQSGHAGVRRWTRKVDIFEYDVIPVPVHVGQVHWCMAIINLKNKSIKYYDSMGTPNPKIIKLLEQYLQDEAFDKKKIRYDTSKFVKESVKDVPRQMNGSDCGVFSCMFAEYITRNKPITFTQMHMEYFRQKIILEICKGKLSL